VVLKNKGTTGSKEVSRTGRRKTLDYKRTEEIGDRKGGNQE